MAIPGGCRLGGERLPRVQCEFGGGGDGSHAVNSRAITMPLAAFSTYRNLPGGGGIVSGDNVGPSGVDFIEKGSFEIGHFFDSEEGSRAMRVKLIARY